MRRFSSSLVYGSAIVAMGLLFTAAIFSAFPFVTSDGPVHIAFSNFLRLDPREYPLLSQHYQAGERLHPNGAVYALIPLLLNAFSPEVTESLLQLLCTVGVVAAAWFALRQISPESGRTWLALMIFPFTLHRLFFLGAYNFCLSMAGFFLVIGSFLRLQKHAAPRRAAIAAASICFTFLAHGGGFVAALMAISTLILVQLVAARAAGESWRAIFRAQRLNLAVLASPVPLVLVTFWMKGSTPSAYGIGLQERLLMLARMEVIRVHAGPGEELATLLGPILFGGVAILGLRVWHERHHPRRSEEKRTAIEALALFVAMTVLALVFPDNFGGGWIHFHRLVLFPYIGAVFCLASCPIPKRMQIVLASAAIAVTLGLLNDAVQAQRIIRRDMQPLAEIDTLIGSHCSVLPLVLSAKPLDDSNHAVSMRYEPYAQLATRLELRRDRVSLYNYQARLETFPVQFRPGHNTQELIFHWVPLQVSSRITTIDIERFEKASGTPVDYVLQWGPLSAAPPELQQQILQAESGYRLVYESSNGQVTLFKRKTHSASQCVP
jgi:hypothetical protein